MAMSRDDGRTKHAAETGHDQFTDTVYGVLCTVCHNYIFVDHTNCPPTCREHPTCRQAYS